LTPVAFLVSVHH